MSGVWAILAFTFKESIRARWLLIFALVFFAIAIDIPVLVYFLPVYEPPTVLEVFLPSLVILSFPFIPLLALPMGATSIVDEKESGTLQYILSNPISKSEFFVGKAVGLLISTSAVIFAGLGVATMMVYYNNFRLYPAVAAALLVAAGLNITMLALGLVISSLSRRKATALVLGVLVWFLFTVLSDIGFLSLMINLKGGPYLAMPIILLNPVESTTLLATIGIGGGLSSMGSTGLILLYTLHQAAFEVLLGTTIGWIVVLFLIGFYVFRHSDLA